jgi:long-chain fatty acid transport protein
MIGIAADVTDDFSLYADAQWTRWSKFNELRVEFDSVQPDSVQDESWKNARRIALGGRYKVNDSWAVKAGVAYDESPVPDAARRTPRIPDNDRFWVSAGVQYALSERTQFELGYSHLFVDDVSTDITNNTGSRLVGEWDLGVDIVSAAVTTRF